MNKIDDAQSRLYTAIAGVFDEPFQVEEDRLVGFSNGRVSQYPPPQPVAPCVWLEDDTGDTATVGPIAGLVDVATFPVVIVYDGADRAQIVGKNELKCRVWDAARTVGTPTGWRPQSVDVGGPNLRSTIVEVEMRIGARTLCGSSQLATTEV